MLPKVEIEKLKKIREQLDVFITGSDLPWAKEYTNDGEHFENLLKNASKLERNVKKYFKQLAPKIIDKIDWDKYEKRLNG
jgi:hypothetical protein